MRAVVQRVASASVVVADRTVGTLVGPGLLVYLGVTHDDDTEQAAWMARKIAGLRILRDQASAVDVLAPVLVVSQFTLYGDARKGRRPTWAAAASAEVAQPLYDTVCALLHEAGIPVERGLFGADMAVSSVNDGPVTVWLESPGAAAGHRGLG